jgi:hypothetical protein
MGRACSMQGEMKNINKILVRKLEGRKPIGRTRNRWEVNIRVDFNEVRFKDVNRCIWLRIGPVCCVL